MLYPLINQSNDGKLNSISMDPSDDNHGIWKSKTWNLREVNGGQSSRKWCADQWGNFFSC